MLPVLLAFVFWLMLYGKLGKYAGFVTNANPNSGLKSVFSGFNIPVKVLNPFGSANASPAKPGTGTTGANKAAMPGSSPATGAADGVDPLTQEQSDMAESATAAADAEVFMQGADGQALVGQAAGNVAGGAAGL